MPQLDKTNINAGTAGDHLANERTFLAWIRTSIGIMGFGFVVVKFSLFVKQIAIVLGAKPTGPQTGYSHVIGIVLVALGGITIGFAYFRYINTKKQLNNGVYYHSTIFIKFVTVLIVMVCVSLLWYLLKTT
ncbi:putative membrane protein [Pedobacter sp. UYP30]|uniref:YidH family protein n=1 Tax=Pedobacter sp. UYP30 TaxID=1756400 RepID=UPI00339628C2